MSSLTLKSISKRFGDIRVLTGIDLHVEDGEFCVLLGPSGCGKSTLLNIIAGLIPPNEGVSSVMGKVSIISRLVNVMWPLCFKITLSTPI